MTQPKRFLWALVFAGAATVLAPGQASAQSGTVTDDAFLSTNSVTQQLNLNGQGISLIVAGSSAAVGPVQVGATKTFIKFQLPSSLPPGTTATNVQKATLKLFLSPLTVPTGTIDIYPITSAWSESALTPSSPPTLAATAFVPAGAASSAIAVGQANSFLVVDVTSLVQEWINGPSNGGLANDGIALVAHTSSSYVVFDSKESIVTSHEPRLEIVLANSGQQGPAGPQGPQGPQGSQGSQGSQGPQGLAATIKVEPSAMTVPFGTPASVMNAGTPNAADLTFLIPQGPTGLTGQQGPQGPVGINNRNLWVGGTAYNPNDAVSYNNSFWLATAADNGSQPPPGNSDWQLLAAGINNRGVWNPANSYNVNDTVTDAGSYWLALAPTSGTATPSTSCEPSQAGCSADWQLLAAQGQTGATGAQGPQGPQGLQGLMGFQGPPGVPPPNVAVTNANNNFSTPQTVGGSVSITGTGNGLVFPDGSVQTTAATAFAGGQTACFASTSGPNTCPVVLSSSPTPPAGYWPLSSVTTPVLNPTWVPVSRPRANPGSGFGMAVANGLLYIMGGSNGDEAETESYNPATDTWAASTGTCGTVPAGDPNAGDNVACPGSPLPVLPRGRSNLAAASANGPVLQNVYAIAGLDTSSPPAPTSEVDLFNPDANTWTKVAPVPLSCAGAGASGMRAYFAAANLNGRIFVLGGECIDSSGAGVGPDLTVSAYDPATNSWGGAATMPTGREKFTAAVVNGKLYAIGGDLLTLSRGLLSRTPTLTVDVYDLQADSWSSVAPMPNPAFEFPESNAAATVNGLVYVNAGGRTLIYDPSADKWSQGPNGLLGAMVAIGGSLYDFDGRAAIVMAVTQTTYSYAKVCTSPGQNICGQACTNEASDPNNCGSCGSVCSRPANATASCTNGTCGGYTCNTGFTACGSLCTNLQTDGNNCGACGNFCAANQVCTAGQCVSCAAGTTFCPNQAGQLACTNLATDSNNCGACNISCLPPSHLAGYTCINSQCLGASGALCGGPGDCISGVCNPIPGGGTACQ